MADLCSDCGRPLATTAHEQATDGYCWNDTGCLRAQITQAQAEIAALREVLEEADNLANMTDSHTRRHFDAARAKLVPRPLMRSNDPPERCPNCGSPEVESNTPRTTYACGSSDYDQRPGTFTAKCEAKS